MIRQGSTLSRALAAIAMSSLLLSLGCDMMRPQGNATSKGKKPTANDDGNGDDTDTDDPSASSSAGNGTGNGNGTGPGAGANKKDGGAADAGGGDASTGPVIPSNPNGLSFQRDIRPLTERYCTECHHAGGRLFDLTQYPFVPGASQADQASIAERSASAIVNGSMPPAPRDKPSADFAAKLRQWRSDGLNP